MTQDLNPILLAAAQQYGVDPSIAKRVMHIESRGNPNAVSPAGAMGAMQLMPATARELGVDPNDPVQNVQGGVRYLSQMINEFGPEYGPLAYNAGPGRMRRVLAGEAPMPTETQNYQRLMRGDNMASVLPMARGAYGGVTPIELIGGREGSLKVQDPSQISPEAVAATENINRMQEFKRQMLPLAMGSMMSGDAGSRNYGQNTFREAMEGVEPFKMQNGFLTDEGQYITDQDQSGLLKQTISQMNRDRTVEQQQNQQNVQGEDRLADDYRKNTKVYESVLNDYKKLKAATPDAIGDISMVYNYMKILDPTSTVREGEAATVEQARGVPATVLNMYNKLFEGVRLNPEQRSQILNTGLGYAESAANSLRGEHKFIKDISQRRGYNYGNIVPASHEQGISMVDNDLSARKKPSAAQPTGQVGTTGTSQEGRRGVQSNAMLDPESGKHFVVENGQIRFVD